MKSPSSTVLARYSFWMAFIKKRWSAIGAMRIALSIKKTSETPPKSPKTSSKLYTVLDD